MKLVKFLLLLLLFVTLLASKTYAQTADQIQEEIKQYELQLGKLANQAKSLTNQIALFDTQIKVAELKISQTEDKIVLLSGRIGQLETSLKNLSDAFATRATETYKMTRLGDPLIFLLSAPDLNEAVARYHYLQQIQEFDRSLLIKLQETQSNFKDQKNDQEILQKELQEQKNTLAIQKRNKAYLLQVTKNDEKKYQELLAAAKAELLVVLGEGKEVYLRNVNEGDIIGRIIPSASGCSSGQHLHFEVHKNGNVEDPNNYLRSISFAYDYGPDQYNYYGTINPHGSWNWPLAEPIQINQAFGGHTFARTFYPGGTHNGIDMDSLSSTAVKAVKPGKLYAGSLQCGGIYPGTLTYSKVEQADGIISWYLHMTPQ
ncbi:hypothetical protein A3D00_05545 [Candidatus Woesebacteria bacterium RIFCSPHIGHO2_02_FULL_38_9]|uniref:Peptidase M23 domain-containing protein n=1 Tax=Candidatus Woesebacteria bacterium RIFCSPHIGHO2_01_FULL_39_28 TaxID=1802496 RepID=A0A1F7YIJ0_9BACT|nr:MAG: hypothetical protein A2627_05925 [Candidatus Woesebacteria bacterium RIFCSPHIGHO2_01_FULL_39_28]OGM32018.1 MAG: hypothetical protein A3D00_05545 [Candidatus Woesebacteria bacterium RIFCSPHIGHO2_02_FULL_38_9]OGM57125.1 MAG: hypothetical protein A3A50_00335 [Candidatus Woesebacteria bacterium RIFCSPLOWO2_01_FULL_38_20]